MKNLNCCYYLIHLFLFFQLISLKIRTIKQNPKNYIDQCVETGDFLCEITAISEMKIRVRTFFVAPSTEEFFSIVSETGQLMRVPTKCGEQGTLVCCFNN